MRHQEPRKEPAGRGGRARHTSAALSLQRAWEDPRTQGHGPQRTCTCSVAQGRSHRSAPATSKAGHEACTVLQGERLLLCFPGPSPLDKKPSPLGLEALGFLFAGADESALGLAVLMVTQL